MSYDFEASNTADKALYTGNVITGFPYSISLKVRVESFNDGIPLGLAQTADATPFLTAQIDTGGNLKTWFRDRGANSTTCDPSGTISLDTWTTITIVHKSTTDYIAYRDTTAGTRNTTDTNTQWPNSNLDRLSLGAWDRQNGYGVINWFDGKIAEVAIWNAELSPANVSALVNGDAASSVLAANLQHYWSMKNDTGSTIYDSIGSMNLTVTGAAWSTDHPPLNAGGSNIIRGVKGMTGGMQNLSGGTQ